MAKNTTPKTNLHAIFATNPAMVEEGAWVEVNALYGLSVKVRRMRSEAATKAYEKMVREEMGEGKLRTPKDLGKEASADLMTKHIAQNILVDWKNMRDAESGDEIEYSPALAYELLSDPSMSDFRDFVLQAASERDTFREKADEDGEGN